MKKKLFFPVWILLTVCLVRGATKSDLSPYLGEYRLPEGGWVTFTRMGVVDEIAQPVFINWQNGRYGQVMAAGTDRFVSPPAATPDAPWQTELVFRRDSSGRAEAVAIRENGVKPVTARRGESWSDREVTFPSGEISLAATLRLPAAKKPLPAIVLVHGSGPGTRSQLAVLASFFARLGMAVLWYDKRGCGNSGGDWKKVDLEELAADALAGVEWLRARPEVDGKRIGLWGISQGGWITPLAAALDPGLAFAINSSGPGTSLRRQDTYMMANVLKAGGICAEDAKLFMTMLGTLYEYGRGKASAAALDALSEQVRLRPDLKNMALPPAREITPAALYARQAIGDPAWFYHLDPDRDALEPYRKLHCPLLVTYGKLDSTVPVEESVKLISETLRSAGHPDFSVELLATAGHGFIMMKEGEPPAPVQPGRLAWEFFTVIENWLRRHGFSNDTK